MPAEAARWAGPGVGADEQVGPLQQGGGLGDGEPAGPVAEVRRAARSPRRPSTSSGPPTTITRQPSPRNRPIRSCQCRVGQRLAAVPAPRWTASSGAVVAEPAGVEPVGLVPGDRRPRRRRRPDEPRRPVRRDRRRPRRDELRLDAAGPGVAEPLGDRGPGRRRSRGRRPGPGRRRRPQPSSRASRDSTSCRPGTQSATSVSRNPPPPIAQPTRRGMPARARTSTVRMSPRTSIPRSYPPPRSDRPERPDRRAERPAPRPPLEPVPLGQVDAVDVRVGLEDLAVARRGQHVDRRLGIGRAEPRRQIGLVRTASPMWSSWTTRIRRGIARGGPAGTARQIAHQDRADGVERADRDPPAHLL